MKCIDYGSEALNKVYGGMNCQTHPHDLPFTGMEIGFFILVGLILIGAGLMCRMDYRV